MNDQMLNDLSFFMLQKIIQARVSPEEMMAILAEECTELAHAALKCRRAFKNDSEEENDNPTPVSTPDALKAMYEEIADVGICLKMLEMLGEDDIQMLTNMMLQKGVRWVERLKDNE